jgi:DNA-binding winged helix-turn-helix (wHTH) protein/tetratricopeptide (TPR) repeat protein
MAAAPEWLYVFGSFRLDPTRGLLHFGSEIVPLPGRLLQLLLALIAANGSVVEKDTLALSLWPDGDATDGNLSQHMYMLRRILGERARDRAYVMTVHGKGYRFAAPVSVVSPAEIESPGERIEGGDGNLLRSGLDVCRHFGNGSYQLEKKYASALRSAIEHFEAALEIDPDYTPALVGLAKAYAFLAEYWYAPPSYTFPKAKFAIMRALKLDPSSAVAHAVLSNIMLYCDWDWKGAQRERDISLQLNPNSISACANAAWYYVCAGDREAAMSHVQRALLIEPSSPPLQVLLGRILLHTGDYERAISYFANLIEAGAEFAIARRHRAQALILANRPAEALVDLLLLPVDRAEDVSLRLPLLGRAYADCGDTARAGEIYASLRQMARNEYVVYWNLALVAVGLGLHDEALDYLEKALEQREPTLLLLRTFPFFDAISRQRRFKSLLRAIDP